MKEPLFPHIEELDYGGLDKVVERAAKRLYVASGNQVDLYDFNLTLQEQAVLGRDCETAHHYMALATFQAEGRNYLCGGYSNGLQIKDLESGKEKSLLVIGERKRNQTFNSIDVLDPTNGRRNLEQILVASHGDFGTIVLPLHFFEEQESDNNIELSPRQQGEYFIDFSRAQVAGNDLYLMKKAELYQKFGATEKLVAQFNSPVTCVAADKNDTLYVGLAEGQIRRNGEVFYLGDETEKSPIRQILVLEGDSDYHLAFIKENVSKLFLSNVSGQVTEVRLTFFPRQFQYGRGQFFFHSRPDRLTRNRLYVYSNKHFREEQVGEEILTLHVGGR